VARDGDRRPLIILGVFDPLIQAHHMSAREAAPVDHDQVAVKQEAFLRS
jgi:hypothetical protein